MIASLVLRRDFLLANDREIGGFCLIIHTSAQIPVLEYYANYKDIIKKLPEKYPGNLCVCPVLEQTT